MSATILVLAIAGWAGGGLAGAQDITAAESPAPADGASDGGADEGEARLLFEAGSRAFAQGQFRRALEHFTRAYELSRRPPLLYNIGLAADRLRRDAEALDAFERYLAAEPESPHRAPVEARIAALRQAVADQEAERAEREAERRRAAEERLALQTRATDAQSGSVLGRWWFWAIVGVAVAGAAVATVLIVTHDAGIEEPIPGTQGIVIATLR